MAADERSFESVLADLERRLARVERHLHLRPVETPPAEVNGGAHAEASWLPRAVAAHRRAAALPVTSEPLPVESAPPAFDRAEPAVWENAQRQTAPATSLDDASETQPTPPPLPRFQQPASATAQPPRPAIIPAYETPEPAPLAPPRQTELEQTIGLKWAGWVGAVVAVIGVGLGIKYAYDQHWFEILPPGGRLALMSLVAFALIGAGEYVYRRIHVFAAACLYGAGVASLFLVSYAGFGYYRLYEQQTAFLLMALSTVAGAAVAMRGNFVSIAVLAQIGGNLAPILLRTDNPKLVPFLAYLLTLQTVALALAWWGGRAKWWTLRGMALVTTSLWMLGILVDARFADSTAAKLVFCTIYAALFQGELILSALRGAILRLSDPAQVASHEQGPEALETHDVTPTNKSGVAFSMLVTALLTAATIFILHGAAPATRGAWVLALSAACGTLGFLLTRGRVGARHELGIGYRIQAAALLVVAVPVALSGIGIIAGWAALAIAFATLGKVLDLPLSRRAGVLVWALAALYLVAWTIDPDHGAHYAAAHKVWLRLLGTGVPAYAVVAWLLAFAGHAVAWLVRRDGPQPQPQRVADDDLADESLVPHDPLFLSHVTHGLAGLLCVAVSIAALPPAGATFAILAYAWLLLGADLLAPRLNLSLQSGAAVAVALVKWMAVDTLAERLSPGWSATARTPFFNAVMGVGVLISLTMAALYWLRRDVLWAALSRRGPWGGETSDGYRTVSPAAPAITLAAALVFVMTLGLSFEIDRVIEAAAPGSSVWRPIQLKQMAWTVLWTITTCGFLALSRRLEPEDALRPGWVRAAERLVLALAVKYLLFDTLPFRATARPPLTAVVLNFQGFTAMIVVGGLLTVAYLMTGRRTAGDQAGKLTGPQAPVARRIFAVAGFFAVLVVLWAGTLEIDRWFEQLIAAGSTAFSDPARAKQVAFSIFWSLFAVSAVVAGFRFRTAGLRYFGLGLFAVTVLKVVLLDMSQVQTGYRVLSFLGLGLLLMGTSVLYGKLSPVLLRDRQTATP